MAARLILQIVLSIVVIALVLIQTQGTGLGKSFGGDSMSYHSKKGIEKGVYYLTMAVIMMFVVLSVFSLVVR